MQITRSEFVDAHTIVAFDLSQRDPDLAESFRMSELEINYDLQSQPSGVYDVTVVTGVRKELVEKRVGGGQLIG